MSLAESTPEGDRNGIGPADHAPEVAPIAAESSAPERFPVRGIVAAALAWMVPGLGHAWLGDRLRGAIFAAVLLGLFFGGIGLHGVVYRTGDGDPLTTLAAVGSVGIGLPYALAWQLEWGLGDHLAPYFEYGNTFTLAAGLLNMLVLLDAFDVGSGRRS